MLIFPQCCEDASPLNCHTKGNLPANFTANIMSSLTLSGLEGLLAGLALDAGQQLKTPIPAAPTADILTRPVDIYRSYLTSILSDIVVDCDRNVRDFRSSTSATPQESGRLP